MKWRLKERRHLSRQALMAHAESLTDAGKPVDAAYAAHIAGCAACAAEVQSIRRSLEIIRRAPRLEPSPDLAAQILVRARSERHNPQAAECHRKPIHLAMAWAMAAGLILVAGLGVYGHGAPVPERKPLLVSSTGPSASSADAEHWTKTVTEVRSLAAAVRTPIQATPREIAQRRAVQAMDKDIAAALVALERNPGCARASRIVQSNLERQNQTLRNLYAARNL